MQCANRSLAQFCLCSLFLTLCPFSLLTQQLALCWGVRMCGGGGVCTEDACVSFWSCSTLWVKAPAGSKVCVLISDALTKWPVCKKKKGEQMHFLAFDLWVNNLQIKRGEKRKWMYRDFLHRGKEQTRSCCWQIRQTDRSGWRSLTCPCRFSLHWPYFISRFISNTCFLFWFCWAQSLSIPAFIEFQRIFKANVWTGVMLSLLNSDEFHRSRRIT